MKQLNDEARKIIEILDRRKATNEFYYFAKLAWKIIEPNTPFVGGWHLEAICKHLEATLDGRIRKLIINMPPRHMKSTLVSVLFPAWVWIKYPYKKWLFSSYAQNLSTRDSLKCRLLLESNWYRNFFKIQWTLADDQNQKTKFLNSEQGYRLATSVGGMGTGDGGDYIICDDASRASDIYSIVHRANVIRWWDEEMSSRLNDQATGVRILVMQRLHYEDLTGHLLAKGGWDHLVLPAEYEGNKNRTSIGWEDPRENVGDILWPEKFSRESLDDLKADLGSMAAAGQLQQRPAKMEGNLIKRKWFKLYDEAPIHTKFIGQFWDTAQQVGISNDYSVCTTWAETDNGYFLLDVWRNKLEFPQLVQAVENNYNKFKPNVVMIEDKSSGSSLIQQLRQKTKMPLVAFNPKMRDKIVRASAITPIIESGSVYVPRIASWSEDYFLELEGFPNLAHDDLVDSTSMALEYLINRNRIRPSVRAL